MAVGRNIKGITIEIDGDTTKLTNAIKKSEQQIRQSTNGLKDVNKLLNVDPGNTELLTQKYKMLQSEIDGCRTKLNTLKEAQAQMVREGKVGTDEYDALQREIIETEQKLKGLTQEMRNFGSVSAQQIAVAGEKVKKVGDGMQNVGQKLMPVTAALTAAGTVSVSKFAEVDKTMTLANQTMGNTAEQANLLNKAMKDAAMNSTFGMNDAAQASLNFARAGLSAEQAAAAMAPAMNLAAGEGGNLDTVSAGLVATINGFGDSFDNTTHYADVFASACNNSALDIDSLSDAMSIAAPIFKTAGYSVDDAALYMGVMANNGIEASEAANSLKTGFARLVSPAKEGAEMMDQLGISVTNADGTMKDCVTIQSELHDAFAGLSESEQIAAASAIFGKNQMSKWLALINASPADVQKLSGEISNCAGTTQEMADAMMSGFGGSLEKLKSSVDVAATSLGEALAPTIEKVANGIQKAVDWFNSLDSEQQTAIANALLLVAALGPVLIVGGKIVSGIGTIMTLVPQIVGGISAVATFITGTAIPAISGLIATAAPLVAAALPIIAVAGLVVAAGVLVVKNWDEIKEAGRLLVERTQEHWENIKNNVTEAASTLKERTVEHFENMKQGINDRFDMITEAANTLKERTTEHFENLKNNLQEKFNTIAEAVNTFKERTVEHFENFKNSVKEKFDNVKQAANDFKERVRESFEGMKQKVTDAINAVKQKFEDMKSGLNSAIDNVKSKLDSFKQKFDDIKSHISSVVDWLKNCFKFDWKLPDLKLPHISISGSFSIDPPSAPHFSIDWYAKAMEKGMILNSPTIFGAMGGRLLGAGEAGSEAVVGTASLQNMITSAVAAGGYGGDIVIPVYIGNNRLETLVVKAEQISNYRSGGR